MAVTALATVRASLKSLVESVTSYSELKHVDNAQKSAYKAASQKYGVRTLNQAQTGGNLRHVTYDVTFEVTLVKAYKNTQMSSDVDDVETELQQLQMDVFKEVCNTKINQSTIVIHSLDHSIVDSEILEDDRVVISKATFTSIFRVALD